MIGQVAGIGVSKTCVGAAGWLILQGGRSREPSLLSTHLQHGLQHFVVIYATEVCCISRSLLGSPTTVSQQQRDGRQRECQRVLTSSALSSSSGTQLLGRRLRLVVTFLLGSSSLSESVRIEVHVKLATFPPTRLHTESEVG